MRKITSRGVNRVIEIFKRAGRVIRLLKETLPALYKLAGSKYLWIELQRKGVVTVGEQTYGEPKVYSWNNQTKLIIGKYCSIAEGVVFLLGGEHRMDWVTTYPFSAFPEKWTSAASIVGHPATKGDIHVGNDVWIGHGALILSGIRIGDGAVIGAGSVVTKDVDDYAIVAGNPAKFLKHRFDQQTREYLCSLNWWDWSHEKISQNIDFLMKKPGDSTEPQN
jgi:acetyltransferase-like isoleucine patch superfamily enzyme